MESRKKRWAPGLALLVLLGASGCSGIFHELRHEDGQVERLRFHGGVSWKNWDRNPYKQDDSAVFLKKEATF
jgi:hypothetical protein